MNNIYINKCILIAVMVFVSCASFAQNTKSQETRKAKLEKEISLIDKQLIDIDNKSKDVLMEISLIKKKIANRQELIHENDVLLNSYIKQIDLKQAEVNLLQSRFDTLSLYYHKLVNNAYKNRDAKIWYLYILASANISQAFRRIGYLKSLSGQMNIQAKKIQEARNVLEAEKEELELLKIQTEKIKNQRLKEVTSLAKEEGESQQVINKLKKNKRNYLSQIAQKRKQIDVLNKEIQRIIKQATFTSNNIKSKQKVEIDYILDSEFAKNKGKLPWPANGAVVEGFGQRYHAIFKNVKLPYSNGITIALSANAKITSIFDGVVKQIVVIPGYNKCVLIQHGKYFSFYCRMGEVIVKAGDKVKTNQLLGTVATIDGNTTLHLEIWNGSKPNDPLSWLRP